MLVRRIVLATAAAVLGASLVCGAVQAQSLKDRQEHQAAETAVTERAKRTASTCGTPIATAFDWAGAKSEDLQAYSAKGFCGDALAAIESVCADGLGKQAVAKRIKALSCSFGAARAIAIDADGTLRYVIAWKAENNEAAVKTFLLNNL